MKIIIIVQSENSFPQLFTFYSDLLGLHKSHQKMLGMSTSPSICSHLKGWYVLFAFECRNRKGAERPERVKNTESEVQFSITH
jgi:hypothetical protein